MAKVRSRASRPSSLKFRRRDRSATETALIEAAAGIFAERGYETATTKTIAERAGCSEALIQSYFKGKEGLLLAVIQQEKGGPLDQRAFFARPLRATLELEARETMTHIADVLTGRATKLRIVLSRVLVDPQFRDEFNRVTVRRSLSANLERRFASYVAAGRLPPGFDGSLAAEMLVSLSFQLGFIDREVLRVSTQGIKRRIREYAAVFGRGIAAASA